MTDEGERHQFIFVPNVKDQLIAIIWVTQLGKEIKTYTLIKIS